MIHFHHCPTCYIHHQCDLACYIEDDLRDGDRQFGAHCNCDSCEKGVDEPIWASYNGFTRTAAYQKQVSTILQSMSR